MIYLLDTNQDYDECAGQFKVPPERVGQLVSPLTRFSNRNREVFGIDNGSFKRFDAKGFLSLLEREKPNRKKCLFVAVPDVVGSARRTLEVFRYWYPKLHGWPLALVCQDGQEDLEIPWSCIEAVFIGGTDNWKLSVYAEACVRAAKAMGKHTHLGRVNSPARLDLAKDWPLDSVDGSGISQYTHMRERIAEREHHPMLVGM